MDIPELLEFENDMFGGDFNEKIQEMERVYAGIPDGKISDEVRHIIFTVLILFSISISIFYLFLLLFSICFRSC